VSSGSSLQEGQRERYARLAHCSFGLSATSQQYFSLRTKPATSNQPIVLSSQNKSAPVTSHQPNEQAVGGSRPGAGRRGGPAGPLRLRDGRQRDPVGGGTLVFHRWMLGVTEVLHSEENLRKVFKSWCYKKIEKMFSCYIKNLF
jgi:hypothetical protein